MKVVIINGQNHKGSTYHIARMLAEKTGGEIKEFFLPKDFGNQCIGCTQCFMVHESKCPHYKQLTPITEALNEADLIIMASPVYVYHCTGQMKSLLDHYGYRWVVHRPDARMFSKQAVVISTAAGAGMKSTNKDMSDSLSFWGISKIYKMGYAVQAIGWEEITEKRRAKIEHDTDKLARKISVRVGKVRPSIKTKLMFEMMRLISLNVSKNPADVQYYKDTGWDGKGRPWK